MGNTTQSAKQRGTGGGKTNHIMCCCIVVFALFANTGSLLLIIILFQKQAQTCVGRSSVVTCPGGSKTVDRRPARGRRRCHPAKKETLSGVCVCVLHQSGVICIKITILYIFGWCKLHYYSSLLSYFIMFISPMTNIPVHVVVVVVVRRLYVFYNYIDAFHVAPTFLAWLKTKLMAQWKLQAILVNS